MAEYDYDLFVVGAGSGGVRAARVASELGARVGIAEMARMGGDDADAHDWPVPEYSDGWP